MGVQDMQMSPEWHARFKELPFPQMNDPDIPEVFRTKWKAQEIKPGWATKEKSTGRINIIFYPSKS